MDLLEADVDRRASVVSDALRNALRAQTRLYNIPGYGGDVERLVSGEASADRWMVPAK